MSSKLNLFTQHGYDEESGINHTVEYGFKPNADFVMVENMKYYVANMGFTRNEVDKFGREVKVNEQTNGIIEREVSQRSSSRAVK